MPDDFLPISGEPVAVADLRVRRAADVARVVAGGALNFVRLLECRRRAATVVEEAIVVETDVEVPQHPVHEIHAVERIALVFREDDAYMPEVLALRADFPLVPHLNLRDEEFPRSLCLYDAPWSDLRLSWTPRGIVERAREWLGLTATGALHQSDQPLEPLLGGTWQTLVVPPEAVDSSAAGWALPLRVRLVTGGGGDRVYIAERAEDLGPGRPGASFVATTFATPPQTHGVIRQLPRTLDQLHRLLAETGSDLLGDLRARLRRWRDRRQLDASPLILLVVLPKTRQVGGGVEEMECRAFATQQPIAAIRQALADPVALTAGADPGRDAPPMHRSTAIGLIPLNVSLAFTRASAVRLSGLGGVDNRRVTAIGVGALGSQVVTNLVREGWGRWTFVDRDDLLPHNLARHALPDPAVGWPKAAAMAAMANAILEEKPGARSIVADVLAPGPEKRRVERALRDAQLVLDLSASVAVARFLARDLASPARRVSFFLSPSGTDSVLLAESADRTVPLDLLELRYYRELIANPALAGHLARGDYVVRYGGSCRDVSLTLPQDLVALHAALGSRALRMAVNRPEAAIRIWQANFDDGTVVSVRVPPPSVVVRRSGNWLLCVDQEVLDVIGATRRQKLPNETGGVLVGAFDTQRNIAYVVDAVPSPPDSEEWPTLYVRGCRGLKRRIDEISRLTDGMLGYAGEWHTHPDGQETAPSDVDRRAFATLAAAMAPEGLPALMLIAAEHDRYGWYVGAMP